MLANEPFPRYELLPSGVGGEMGAAEGSRGGRRGRSKDKVSSGKTGSSSSIAAKQSSSKQE